MAHSIQVPASWGDWFLPLDYIGGAIGYGGNSDDEFAVPHITNEWGLKKASFPFYIGPNGGRGNLSLGDNRPWKGNHTNRLTVYGAGGIYAAVRLMRLAGDLTTLDRDGDIVLEQSISTILRPVTYQAAQPFEDVFGSSGAADYGHPLDFHTRLAGQPFTSSSPMVELYDERYLPFHGGWLADDGSAHLFHTIGMPGIADEAGELDLDPYRRERVSFGTSTVAGYTWGGTPADTAEITVTLPQPFADEIECEPSFSFGLGFLDPSGGLDESLNGSTVHGSLVLTPISFWEYRDEHGAQPLYNAFTGAALPGVTRPGLGSALPLPESF